MEELSGNLVTSVTLLKQPVEAKVLHHHHMPKLIWVSAALFIVLCLTFCGWYNTSQKLDWHTANDFKYRYLKLKNHPICSNYSYLQTAYTRLTPALPMKFCTGKILFVE
jgi:hypothetical protein